MYLGSKLEKKNILNLINKKKLKKNILLKTNFILER